MNNSTTKVNSLEREPVKASDQPSRVPGVALYVGEAGCPHPFDGSESTPCFIVGVLVTPEAEAFRSEIEAFRATQHYHGPYRWSETSDHAARQAYLNLAEYLQAGTSSAWDFHATRFPSRNVNREDFGHDRSYASRKTLQIGIDEALKAMSPEVGGHLQIVLPRKRRDGKTAYQLSATIEYLEKYYSDRFPMTQIEIKWREPGSDRNLEICNLFASSHHSYFTPDECGFPKWKTAKAYAALGKCSYQEYIEHFLHPQEILADSPPKTREDFVQAAIETLHAKYGATSRDIREEPASQAISEKPKLAANGKLVAIETSENAFVVVNRWDYPRGTFHRELVSIDPHEACPNGYVRQTPSSRDVLVEDARAILADRLGVPAERIIEKIRPPYGTLEGEVIALGEKHFAVVRPSENRRFTIVKPEVFSFEKPAVGDYVRIKFSGKFTEGTLVHRPVLRHESQGRKAESVRDKDGQGAKSLAHRI
ncbi:MAG TPA: hypothetical protein VGZ00_04190 [Candidatus Baltobacteraceae bacterium]|jgi:hypothetical protein|nr:hypothetical protein [Candidatus Baltobacteraceae bacterium]